MTTVTPSKQASAARSGAYHTTRNTAAILGLCLLLALTLRVLSAARSGLWRDEALFLFVVRSSTLGEMLSFLREHESHPPLFYLLMRAWLGVVSESEATALALPILFGAALIPVVYFTAIRMFSRRTALIAVALAAVSPTLVLHSALVRPYSLMPLLCLVSVFYMWRAIREGSPRLWAAHGAATLALLFIHNWSWMVYGAQWVVFGAALALPLLRPRFRLICEWLAVQALVLMAYAFWVPTLLYQAQHAGHGPAPVGSLFEGFLVFARTSLFFPGTQAGLESDPVSIGLSFAALAILVPLLAVAIRRVAREARAGEGSEGRHLALLLLIGVPLVAVGAATVLSAKSYLLAPRCLATVVPCLLLAVAHGIGSLSVERRFLPLAGTAVMLTLSLTTSLAQTGEIKSNARQMAEAVAAQIQPSDLVVVTPEWIASSFNYYFKPDNPQINFPHEGREGATPFNDQRKRLIDPQAYQRIKARLTQARREGRRVWLIMDRDHLVELPESLLDDDVLSEEILNPGMIGLIRSNQLRRNLTLLYGPPNTDAVPPYKRFGDEVIVAFLFTPAGR